MQEEIELDYFLDAYFLATGKRLLVIRKTERPDFICHSGENGPVGVELTKLIRSPKTASWERNVELQMFRDPSEAYHGALEAAIQKSGKINSGTWQLPERTILVLQDMDCPLDELYPEFQRRTSHEEFCYLGFCENLDRRLL